MRLNSTVRLTSDGTVQRVDLTYDVQDGDEVQVYFNDDEILTGWTLQRNTNPQRVDFDEKVPAGTTVLIRRYTDMRELPHFFHFTGNAKGGAEFNGKNLDENFDKILRAAQDAMDSFEIVGINIQAAYDAKTYAAEAKTYKDAAESARDRAVSAEAAARLSADSALVLANKALDSEVAARSSEIAAAGSAGAAESSATQAAASADAAASSAGEAAASAASALASKEAATLSANAAKNAEDAATTASSNAQESADEAEVSAGEAAASATEAAASEDLAKRWATNPEDEVVEDGLYSAKHWAIKAEQVVVGAEDVITRDTPEIKFSGTGRPLSPLEATIGSVDVSKVEGLGSAATGNVVQGTGNSTTDVMSQKTVTDALDAKVDNNDSRLSNAREWTATTVSQAEAEAGTSATRRAWTAQRVRQAIVAWFNGVSGTIGRTILGRNTAAQVRGDLGLGSAATRDVGTTEDTVAAGDDSRITGALQKSSNLSDVANKGTARTNLGLGTAATRNVGENAGNVMQVGAGGILGVASNYSADTKGGITQFVPSALPSMFPSGVYNYGSLLSMAHDFAGEAAEIAVTHIDDVLLFRGKRNQGWNIVYHTGNKPSWSDIRNKPSYFNVTSTGDRYETGAIGTANNPPGTADMPSQYVMTGLRTTGSGNWYSIHARGYRLLAS